MVAHAGKQIFTLPNIIEQCVEYRHAIYINVIDFKKAFDSIHRDSLWAILLLYGVPKAFVIIFVNLYLNTSCCVRSSFFLDHYRSPLGVHPFTDHLSYHP